MFERLVLCGVAALALIFNTIICVALVHAYQFSVGLYRLTN